MPDAGRPQRTTCVACLTACRAVPTEITWRETRGKNRDWLYASRDLCQPCRRAQKAFWFRRARPVARHFQLRLLSDVEAPLKGVDLAEVRLSRRDVEDPATGRAAGF